SHPPAQPSRPSGLGAQPILDVDGQRYLLTGQVTVLGRGSEADIIVADTGVSRQHVEIRITPDGVIATDLGSTNGTFVEGHRIDAATLVDGNTLTIGRTRVSFWAGSSGDVAGANLSSRTCGRVTSRCCGASSSAGGACAAEVSIAPGA